MNLLLFEQHELHENHVVLKDHREKHIRTVLKLSTGESLRVGMVDGNMGRGKIIRMENKEVELQVQLENLPSSPPDIELILALPRPIMLQRILKQATVLGVRRLHLIRSAKVEKSFFQTPVLEPAKIRELLLEGLSQAVDTRLPEVTIHQRFKPFVQDVLPTLGGYGVLAHPGIKKMLPQISPTLQKEEKILLAIGPEGGWNDFEVENFLEQGFSGFSMGNRILHVDTAVVALLAQLQLLRAMQ
ncbi:MAG: 16S rRNA (uracil(1498)-N(3))-methyltransferase [Candidatus Electrothrix aestuarii]|uniref:Ribosomal RNA small subunit methyltransferase E n=1 Tax=Candidatus Electrothrix aestuarii TaxID=3062594 RepID=A0AAU8LSD4_9BACT|nr:16S rRNA (uracil(1498)-N(3))-methyltransferase [Candidatus Electrothrix aestuarii]